MNEKYPPLIMKMIYKLDTTLNATIIIDLYDKFWHKQTND